MRKLFIGSSSEGKQIAIKLKKALDKNFPKFLKSNIWTDGKVFSLNRSTLDSLIEASRKFDYGVLVATSDDIRKLRGKQAHIPRDNVMFEMGMFLGSLGLTRAFLLVEKSSTLPTDYNGVTVPSFEKDVRGSLNIAINKIISAIENTKTSFNLKPLPSAALASGYFDNFIYPLCKRCKEKALNFKLKVLIPKNITKIYDEIKFYKQNHPSEEISVFDDGQRPRVNKLIGEGNQYWDIPTTLTTLNKLINLINPSTELGAEQEKIKWINHELLNFKGTIEILVKQHKFSKGSVSVTFLK